MRIPVVSILTPLSSSVNSCTNCTWKDVRDNILSHVMNSKIYEPSKVQIDAALNKAQDKETFQSIFFNLLLAGEKMRVL